MSHTPGPWTTRQQFANRWLIEKDQGTNEAGERLIPLCLAAVHTTILEVGCGDEDTAANAQIMAAAPDMFDAIREYLAAIDAEPEKDIWDTWDGKPADGAEKTSSDAAWAAHGQHVERCLTNLRAAISKAEALNARERT